MSEVPEAKGIDLILTDEFVEKVTSPTVYLIVCRQMLDSVTRKLTEELGDGLEVVGQHHELLEDCEKPEGKCHDEPHKHFKYEYRLMTKDQIGELQGA